MKTTRESVREALEAAQTQAEQAHELRMYESAYTVLMVAVGDALAALRALEADVELSAARVELYVCEAFAAGYRYGDGREDGWEAPFDTWARSGEISTRLHHALARSAPAPRPSESFDRGHPVPPHRSGGGYDGFPRCRECGKPFGMRQGTCPDCAPLAAPRPEPEGEREDEAPLFTRDSPMPAAEFSPWVKRTVTLAKRISGPFRVQTREGVLRCENGWLAVDSHGWPYPIAHDEFTEIYRSALASPAQSEDERWREWRRDAGPLGRAARTLDHAADYNVAVELSGEEAYAFRADVRRLMEGGGE